MPSAKYSSSGVRSGSRRAARRSTARAASAPARRPPARISASSRRTSRMSRGRSSASLRRQRRTISRTRGGVPAGSAVQSGSRSRMRAMQVGSGLAAERRPAGEALEQHAAERPDVAAPVHRRAARLLGAHVGGGAEDDAGHGRGARRSSVGELPVGLREVVRAHRALGEPEVEHLGVPEGVIMTLPGLRSRCTMPRSCAASIAAATCTPTCERLAQRQRARARGARPASRPRPARAPGSGAPARVLEPVDRGDVRVVERGQRLRLALEARQPLGVARRTPRAAP